MKDLVSQMQKSNINSNNIFNNPKPITGQPLLSIIYNSGSETAESVKDNENLQKTKNNNSTREVPYTGLRDCCLMDCASTVPDHDPWPSGKQSKAKAQSQSFQVDFDRSTEAPPTFSPSQTHTRTNPRRTPALHILVLCAHNANYSWLNARGFNPVYFCSVNATSSMNQFFLKDSLQTPRCLTVFPVRSSNTFHYCVALSLYDFLTHISVLTLIRF